MIRETIVTTMSAAGVPHVAPLGATVTDEGYLLMPFRPSTTLENLAASRCACINFTDDARIFAGCVTRVRRDWPTVPALGVRSVRLAAALAHDEVEVVAVDEDPERPRFHCRVRATHLHAPFKGMNRARAAIVEAAVLVSRLHMLPAEKIDAEMAYLAIAVEKTAGPEEREAWGWILEAIRSFRTGSGS